MKIGDKVYLKQTGTKAIVSKIVNENGKGEEVVNNPVSIRMFLTSDYGECKVYLHDRNHIWVPFYEVN